LLERHLARLLVSAAYFSFDVGETAVRAALDEAAKGLTGVSKVRLLVGRNGRLQTEVAPLSDLPEPACLGLALEPVRTDDLFLYHKTTQREVYDRAKAACPACDEVVLWNERGELTETTTANIVLEVDGVLWTPPVECGLLAGTLREELVENGRLQEKVLSKADLVRAEKVYLLNSVRGWRVGEML
jgi:para-aminobenzoate synthetase / 4-amino-4-deoxychorismate lyase